MKKYIISLISILLFPVLFSSCLESYLDKSPESGLVTNDVFKKLDNFKKFFLAVYDGRQLNGSTWTEYNIKTGFPFYFDQWDQKFTWEGMTDCTDPGRYIKAQGFKSGQVASFVDMFTYDRARRPILGSMFQVVRICNMTLENIHLLEADPVVINDYTAQAHFCKGICPFRII